MGAYHGFDGFCTFSKRKGVLVQNSFVGSFLDVALKPPYRSLSDRTIGFLMWQNKARPIQQMKLPGK
jgi:coniferyl-aldehyde dehydrogenase